MTRITLSALLGVLLFAACQKEISTELPPGIADSTGIWIMTHKTVENIDTSFGQKPFTLKAGYAYDTLTRTITYDDTATHEGIPNPFIYHTTNTYSEAGLLVRVQQSGGGIVPTDIRLSYDATGMLEGINTGSGLVFEWTPEGQGLVGKSTDASDGGGPYSESNKFFTLDQNKRLIKKVDVSGDLAYGDAIHQMTRDIDGDVIIRKSYESKADIDYIDSLVYTRDKDHEPRLSSFYALLGRGIAWYSNYYGIRFIEPPSFFSEYFEFDNSICNKVVHFVTYKNVNGQMETVKYIETDFANEYDNNGNLVKQTTFVNGEKVRSVSFKWKKIEWLN